MGFRVNLQFDYNQFPKDQTLKHDVKVDLSGISLKTSSSALEVQDDGSVDEVDLNQTVTDNVNFIYTGFNNDSYIYSYQPNDSDGNPVINYEEGNSPDIEFRLLHEDVEELDILSTLQDPAPSTLTLSNNYTVNILPRHKLIDYTLPQLNMELLAAFGFVPHKRYKLSIAENASKQRAVLTKRQFKRKFNQLANECALRGVELTTKTYPAPNPFILDIDTSDPDHPKIIKATDINKTILGKHSKVEFAANVANEFINRKLLDGEMKNITSATPFNMSIKDAFKSYFDDSEEMYNEFVDAFIEIIKTINSNYVLMHYTDDIDGVIKEYEYANIDNVSADVVSGAEYAYFKSNDEEYPYSNTAKRSIYFWDNDVRGYKQLMYEEVSVLGTDAKAGVNIPAGDYSSTTTMPIGVTIKDGNYFVFKRLVLNENDYSNADSYKAVYDKNLIFKRHYKIDISNVNAMIDALTPLNKQVNRIIAVAIGSSFISAGLGAAVLAATMEDIEIIKDNIKILRTLIKKIKWYQKYTNESVFPNKAFIEEDTYYNTSYTYNKQLARLLVPVYYGKTKVKYKKRRKLGRLKFYTTIHKKLDLGVRFVEINFVDVNVFSKFKPAESPMGNEYGINIPFNTLSSINGVVTGSLSSDISEAVLTDIAQSDYEVSFYITGASSSSFNGYFSGTVLNKRDVTFNLADGVHISTNVYNAVLSTIISPFPATKPSEDPIPVTIRYKMPHLPYDSELKKKVFTEYGSFDQSEFANKSRSGDFVFDSHGNDTYPNRTTGWEIFKSNSSSISNMREGIDIYNKVALLIRILTNEFGSNRVHVIETTRSLDEQNKLHVGGNISNFLSWHNYGLAIKIKISKLDGLTAIEEGDSDYMKLLDIAEAFIDDAYNGAFGTPCNVVWCAQLVTGPNIFVWEFLPIGIHHKDAVKYRDSLYSQKDPIKELAYINVTANGYVSKVPLSSPYILQDSIGIKNAIVINGDLYVHPKYIMNLEKPTGLILKDLKEYIQLIQEKMNSNGTSLIGRKLVNEWKVKNPVSFNQLVVYNSLLGKYSAVRGLLAGDYAQVYKRLVSMLYGKNDVEFVKQYLGEYYNTASIYVDALADGSFIRLKDGKMISPMLETRSSHVEGNGNMFGEKQINRNSVEYGQYIDGIFYPEGSPEITLYESSHAVISGYNSSGYLSDDALRLHSLLAQQIRSEYNSILDSFNNLNIPFMYDSFFDSESTPDIDYLENEFGVIATQDIIPIPRLRDMYSVMAINSTNTNPDGTVRGVGGIGGDAGDSVYEKLISTSQITGAKRSKLNKEKPIIEPLTKTVQLDDVYKALQKRNNKSRNINRLPKVQDIL